MAKTTVSHSGHRDGAILGVPWQQSIPSIECSRTVRRGPAQRGIFSAQAIVVYYNLRFPPCTLLPPDTCNMKTPPHPWRTKDTYSEAAISREGGHIPNERRTSELEARGSLDGGTAVAVCTWYRPQMHRPWTQPVLLRIHPPDKASRHGE